MEKGDFKIKKYLKIIYLFIIPFVFSSLGFASDVDQEINKTQGILMEIDLKSTFIIVNEKKIFIDQNTLLNNDRSNPVSLDQLKTKGWVYIEWIKDKEKDKALAKRIYLLPRYVDKKDKHLFPFIK